MASAFEDGVGNGDTTLLLVGSGSGVDVGSGVDDGSGVAVGAVAVFVGAAVVVGLGGTGVGCGSADPQIGATVVNARHGMINRRYLRPPLGCFAVA
jgi:hypothetical protein